MAIALPLHMRAAVLLVALLAACGDNDRPIPTNVPATVEAFDTPMHVGETYVVGVSWQSIDYANGYDCVIFIFETTCYPSIIYPFTLREASCEGCRFVEDPDETVLHDGFAELRVIADAPGPLTVRVHVDHAYSDETRELTLSATATQRP